jgi:hypothetical protein
MEAFNPISSGEASLEHKREHSIIGNADDGLRTPVLR